MFLCLRQRSSQRHCLWSVRACVRGLYRKYLWNGWRYPQAVNSVINHDLSCIEQKQEI